MAEKKKAHTGGRQKGTVKTGGRVAGTPNKDKTLKTYLREHSEQYFAPALTWSDLTDEKEQKLQRILTNGLSVTGINMKN